MTDVIYTAVATASPEGREGHVRSSDGRLDVELAIPAELGGSGESGTNPEQLFAAGYAACFTSALHTVGRRERVDTTGAGATARVGVKRAAGRGFALVVELEIAVPGLAQDEAERLVAKAHEVCPYSNAIRGNVPVELTVRGS
jgi:osmotically inducible protein OsmC